MEPTYIPVIVNAFWSPNPAVAGQPVLLSVSIIDAKCVPYEQVITAGEFTAGEV